MNLPPARMAKIGRSACIVLVVMYVLLRVIFPATVLQSQIAHLPAQHSDLFNQSSHPRVAAIVSVDPAAVLAAPTVLRLPVASSAVTALPRPAILNAFAGDSAPLRI